MAEPTPYPGSELILAFADGDYRFALKLPQIAELQEKCGAGIGEVFGRLMRGRYLDQGEVILMPTEAMFRGEDVYETIRLALIGGGGGTVNGQPVKVEAVQARTLVERYVYPLPFVEAWKIAAAIMAARVVGYDDGRPQPVGGGKAAAAKKKPRARAGSTSQQL